MLTAIANGAFEGARSIANFFDDHGASADILKRNLNFVSRMAPELDATALKASGWKGLAAAIMYATTPTMDKALEGSATKATVEEVFKLLQEGRLRGIRDGLWRATAREVFELDSDEDLANAFSTHMARLLDAIEGRQSLPSDLSETAATYFEKGDWEGLRAFLYDTFETTADLVATVMPAERFDEMLADPHVQRAITAYKENAEPAMRDIHEEHEGILSRNLGPVAGGTYFPLVPIKEEEHPGGVGIKPPYIKPKNQANRMATGLSTDYDPTLPTFRKTLERRTHASAKFDLLRQTEETGWFNPIGRDADPRIFTDKYGNEWPGAVREMAPGKVLIRPGQKAIPVGKRYGVMPKILASELDIILEGPDYDEPANGLNTAIHAMNRMALAGAAVMESVFHGKNLAGGIVQNMPAVLTTLGKLGYRKFVADSEKIADVLNSEPTPTSFAQDLVKMARLGILADRFGEMSYSKKMADLLGEDSSLVHRISLAPLLFGPNGLDVMARWLLFKAKESLDPKYTPREMIDYVNQLGIYVNGQQSEVVKFLRAKGFNPFAVAGVAGLGRGLRTFIGGKPPVSYQTSPAKHIGWRLLHLLTVGMVGSIIYWELTHRAVRGKSPIGDVTAKEGKIPITGDIRKQPWAQKIAPGGGTLYLDMQYLNPDIGRGLRATGLQGGFETANKGGNSQQIAEAALVDVLNAWTAPLMGPAVKAGIAALAGVEPHIDSMIDSRGGNALDVMSSIPRKNVPFKTFGQKVTGLPANVGWRARAAVMQLNQMFGVVAEDIGVLPRNPDEKQSNLPRGAVDILLPSFVSGPSNPYGSAARIHRQKSAMR
jgi:hypothetical protein